MHLTNYSINKHNENFDRDDSDDSGSKRYSVTVLFYTSFTSDFPILNALEMYMF